MPLARRIQWAVERLDAAPSDRILEIGCGAGKAVEALCERKIGAFILGIDRSRKAIHRATTRNAVAIACGKADFRHLSWGELDGEEPAFERIFAINVNLFWCGGREAWTAVRSALAHEGKLDLFYQPPTHRKFPMSRCA